MEKPLTDGSAWVSFNVGLEPIVPGHPRSVRIPLDVTIPGTKITVQNQLLPRVFPNTPQWEAELAALQGSKPSTPSYAPSSTSISHNVGLKVPVSPESINFVQLPDGMSTGGFYSSAQSGALPYDQVGSPTDLASYLQSIGFDRVFYSVGQQSFGASSSSDGVTHLAAALAQRGVQLGFVPNDTWGRPFLENPNIAFLSDNLPDYHAPLYRDIQLDLQYVSAYPNIAGISIGADNGAYGPYWDWAPPIPNRPWGEAFQNFQNAVDKPFLIPLAPSLKESYLPHEWEYFVKTQAAFVKYLTRYNKTWDQYAYFAKAATSVNPNYRLTSGSFGSSPGVDGRGGWASGTVPGNDIFNHVPVQQAYNWNELPSTLPMLEEALLGRLKSDNPNKPTWALIDNFNLFMSPRDQQAQYALALTTGVQAVGTNSLPNNVGPKAHPKMIAADTSLFHWIHEYGGAYSMFQLEPRIGILYVHDQALMEGTNTNPNASAASLIKYGSQESKTTEALFMAQASGWPAQVITPAELKRGLPSSMKAILLVGLNNFPQNGGWHWYNGLTSYLQQFEQNGGKILTGTQTAVPAGLPVIQTGIQMEFYVPESSTDETSALLARNQANMLLLQKAMAKAGVQPALAMSNKDTVFAIPDRAGDTRYISVVNMLHSSTPEQTQHLVTQTGSLVWHLHGPIHGPIYDVRLEKQVTIQQASSVNLTDSGFQLYALTPYKVTVPTLEVVQRSSGLYEADVTVGHQPMSGIPIELTVTSVTDPTNTATVYSATGLTMHLPLSSTSPAGTYTVTATELLTGLTKTVTVTVSNATVQSSATSAVRVYRTNSVIRFVHRTQPLTIGLTPAQHANPTVRTEAEKLVTFYKSQGRDAKIGIVQPNDQKDGPGIVLSLQKYNLDNVYPEWRTIPSDLVLFGNPSDNVLLLDQARGHLLPNPGTDLSSGQAVISYANSSFVGGFDVVNVIANDNAGVVAAVDYLTSHTVAVPTSPQFLTTTQITSHQIDLSWQGSSGATAYVVERRADAMPGWSVIATVNSGSTVFPDRALQPNDLYAYRVAAINPAGMSGFSNTARDITLAQAKAAKKAAKAQARLSMGSNPS